VVQEDPEDFARDVGELAAPEFVGAWGVHVEDEVDGAGVGGFERFAEVGEGAAGAMLERRGGGVGGGGEEVDCRYQISGC